MGTGLEVVHSELVNDPANPEKRQLHKAGYEAASAIAMAAIVGQEVGDFCFRLDIGLWFVWFSGSWVGVGNGNVIVTKITSNYTALNTDGLILADATTGPINVTMPPTPPSGKSITVIKIDGSANAVIVLPNSGQTYNNDIRRTLGWRSALASATYDGVSDWVITEVRYDRVTVDDGSQLINADYAHAEGTGNTSSGFAAHAEGGSNVASASYAHAEGFLNQATAFMTHVEGFSNTATNFFAHAEGQGNQATATCAHVEGSTNVASGQQSHAEGHNTTASGDNSHAEGQITVASGLASHAEGSVTTASGQASHAGGLSSEATGVNSFAHGDGAQALHDNTMVLCDANGAFSTQANEMTISYENGLRLLTKQTSFNGDSGSAVWEMPLRGSGGVKKFVLLLNALVSATPIVITFPTAFNITPFISGDPAVMGAAVVTAVDVTLNVVSPVSGYLILEGF